MSKLANSVPNRIARTPLTSIEAVRLVALHDSVSSAAGELGVTPGSLSRRIAAVESWLGLRLFHRHGRGMTLTADGQRFLSRIENAFSIIESAAEPWRGRTGPETIRISTLPSFAEFWLLPKLQKLQGAAGLDGVEVHIDVHVDHLLADLHRGEADLAVRYGRGPYEGVASTKLMAEQLTPVASPEIAHQLGSKASMELILKQPLLYDSDAAGWRHWLATAGLKKFSPRRFDRRFNDYSMVLAAAQAGLGIALARLPFATDRVASAGLVRLSDRCTANPLSFHLLQRAGEGREAVLAVAAEIVRLTAKQMAIY